jgi:hypothetical protein
VIAGTVAGIAAGGDNRENWLVRSDGSMYTLGITPAPLFGITISPPAIPALFARAAAPAGGLLIYS